MSDVVELMGEFRSVQKTLKRLFKDKQIRSVLEGTIIRVRIERVDNYDEQMYG